jgi:hypothetical protein
LELIGREREVVSVFLKPKSRTWPSARGASNDPLRWLLESHEFEAMCPDLGQVKRVEGRFSTLNTLELEGSLVSILLEGGCHGSRMRIELGDARRAVSAAMDAVFPAPFNKVIAFRFDEWDWCDFTDEATVWSSHFVWEAARSLMWVLCTRDID